MERYIVRRDGFPIGVCFDDCSQARAEFFGSAVMNEAGVSVELLPEGGPEATWEPLNSSLRRELAATECALRQAVRGGDQFWIAFHVAAINQMAFRLCRHTGNPEDVHALRSGVVLHRVGAFWVSDTR